MTGSRAYTRPTPVPKMPPGLVELMEGMTKEVLRRNPTNVYKFCATHMEKLLEIRDGPTKKGFLNLNQKISKAQAIIKLRAQERRQKYDKEMQLQVSLSPPMAKTPVLRGFVLTGLEEIEISHGLPTNAITCKDNANADEVILTTKQTSKSIDQSVNQVENELEKIGIILDITETGSNIDEIVVVGSELTDTFKCNSTTELTDNTNSDKNQELLGSSEQEIKNVVKATDIESVTSPILNEIGKKEDNVEMLIVTQNAEQYSEECLINNKKIYIERNENNIKDIKQVKDDNDDIKVDLFYDKTSRNLINTESVQENNRVEADHTCNVTQNSSTSKSTVKNTGNDIVISLRCADNTNPGFLENEREGINNDLPDATDEAILTFNFASTVNQTDTGMLSLGEECIKKSEKDYKMYEANEIEETYDKSCLSNNISPATDISFENPFGIASIDNRGTNNMDLETAAITIQKVFRSFLFKSRPSNDETSSIDEDKEANGNSSPNSSKERRPLGITRMDTTLQTVNEEKSLSLSTDDSSTLSSAATIIQAHIRGFLVRNKLNSTKTASTNSIINSEDPVTPSPDSETNLSNNRTVLNIHIVPEGNMPSLSQDESIVTSLDFSLDGSPLSSINLHPLGYDKSEPRKQLKREDAVQSISPPSNNSGKLSEDVDSTKETVLNNDFSDSWSNHNNLTSENEHTDKITVAPDITVRNVPDESLEDCTAGSNTNITRERDSLTKMSSDEMDVITPFTPDGTPRLLESSNNTKFLHSGELHDVVLPTNVSRSNTSVVSGE